MVKIAPSILSADFMNLERDIRKTEEAGADVLHIDVMDGHFVPNITIGPLVVEGIKKITSLPLDVHLMIDSPERYVYDFISAGADYLTVHAEAVVHLHRVVGMIKEKGVKAGVSLNPSTHESMLEHVLGDLDMVLVMSVNPGFGGQSFIPGSLKKIRSIRRSIDERGLAIELEVDGGVKPSNAREVADAGADMLVMGSAFYGVSDYKALMKELRGILGSR